MKSTEKTLNWLIGYLVCYFLSIAIANITKQTDYFESEIFTLGSLVALMDVGTVLLIHYIKYPEHRELIPHSNLLTKNTKDESKKF